MKRSLMITLSIILLSSACGPSESEIATMTASAWTATPVPTNTPLPTPTPTPIPYDLTIQVQDAGGNPLPGAEVFIPAADAAQFSDDVGTLVLLDLPSEAIDLQVRAQGYLSAAAAVSLVRGPNELSVTLERDPFGILPGDSCLEGEELLYLEDFQDMAAQGWDAFDMDLFGWDIVQQEDGNWVYAASETAGGATLNGYRFDNAVWRLRFMYVGGANPNFEWRVVEDGSYQVGILTADIGGGAMFRAKGPSMNLVGSWNFHPFVNQWYLLEISTFDGEINVYVNGSSIMRPFTEPELWSPGTIRITPFMNPGSQVLLDDMVVCGLSAPFTTMYE